MFIELAIGNASPAMVALQPSALHASIMVPTLCGKVTTPAMRPASLALEPGPLPMFVSSVISIAQPALKLLPIVQLVLVQVPLGLISTQ